MTGRLQGTILGRPVEMHAHDRVVQLRVGGLKSAWGIRRSVSVPIVDALRMLRDAGFQVQLRIGERLSVGVVPEPHISLRLFVPSMRALAARR